MTFLDRLYREYLGWCKARKLHAATFETWREVTDSIWVPIWLVALLAILLSSASATVSFTAQLGVGTGSLSRTAYLHFELFNCGPFRPIASNNPLVIVETSFDAKPSPLTGMISKSVIGNDQILCGNVPSTQWIIQPMKDQNTTAGPALRYYIAEADGPVDFALMQQAMVTPPIPGYRLVYQNPNANQTISQPGSTVLRFLGNIDFSGANVTGFNVAGSFVQRAGDSMLGPLSLASDPTSGAHASTKSYVDAQIASTVASISGSTNTALATKLTKSGDSMTGPLILVRDPVSDPEAATKHYVDLQLINPSADASKFRGVDLASGAPSDGQAYIYNAGQGKFALGTASVNGQDISPNSVTLGVAPTQNQHASTKLYVDQTDAARGTTTNTALALKLDLAGGTMTGPIVLPGAPTTNLQAATKKYVDDQVLTPSANASKIQGVDVAPTVPVDGQALTFNAAQNKYLPVTALTWPLTSPNANPAQSGAIRLNPTDCLSARDTASAVDVCLVSKGTAVTGGSRSKLGGVWGAESGGDFVVPGNLTVTGSSSSVPTPPAADNSTKPINSAWAVANLLNQIQNNGLNLTKAGTLNFAPGLTASYNTGVATVTPAFGTGPSTIAQGNDSRIVNAVQNTRAVSGSNSIAGGGALSGDLTFQLTNDQASPGASMYYGTNGSGVKGWFVVSNGGHVIYNAGSSMTQRAGLNFTGATVTDDSGNGRTNIAIPVYTFNGRSGPTFTPQSGDYTAAQVTGAAADANVVHSTGNETIAGNKEFAGTPSFDLPPNFLNQIFQPATDCAAVAMTAATGAAGDKTRFGVDSDCKIKSSINGGPVYEVPQATGAHTQGKQVTYDPNGILTASAFDAGAGGSATVNVNGSSVSSPNFNNTTPTAQSGYQNAVLQVSGSNISIETQKPDWNAAPGSANEVLNKLPAYLDSANTIQQRNSTNAQVYRVMTTYTDTSNYQGLELGGDYSRTQWAGTGNATAYKFGILNSSSVFRGWQVDTAGNLLLYNPTGTPAIGSSGTRIGTLYVTTLNSALSDGCLQISSNVIGTTSYDCSVKVGVASDVTAQNTSQTTVTVATAPGAGFYTLHYYADVGAACTTGGNSVSFTFNWTDGTTARSLTTGTLSLAQGAPAAAAYLSGDINMWVGSGNVTYTSTVVGSCASGTSTYDMHVAKLVKG
jgi:hypothetical protein